MRWQHLALVYENVIDCRNTLMYKDRISCIWIVFYQLINCISI